MRSLLLIIAIWMVWIVGAIFLAQHAYAAVDRPGSSTMLELHNRAREARGLRPLRVSLKLQRSAQIKVRRLVRCSFSHYACGFPFLQVFEKVGYGSGTYLVGENLAWGLGRHGYARPMFRAWMDSRAHRRNILRPGWKHIGIARLRAGGRIYWVAHFGKP